MEGYGGGGGGGRKQESALASELAQVLSMVRELEARMDQDPPAAARELCGELANTVDRSIRIARSCCGCPPADSPPGHASDGNNNAQSRQVRVASVKDMAPLDDGLSWRKYGQKDILGAKYPRAYFRCTHRHSQGCLATKHVQRADADPLLYDVVYHGAHACVQAAHPSAEELRRELMHMHPGHAAGGGQDQDQEQQQSSSPRAPEVELDTAEQGLQLQSGLLDPMTPYAFAAPTPGDFFPLLSPTGAEWQMMRSSHASAGNGTDLVDHHQFQFDDLFTNAAEPFHWDLYAAN
ncbi:hypothetical protein U9M48_044924 [Paspalum notatum var. saurae]|uniref:WRKY domain-containing protein n=1 Tax=Paspalum notatum var. saurae TaxID=547442 RepID=A0AAQ3UWN8_PASNO